MSTLQLIQESMQRAVLDARSATLPDIRSDNVADVGDRLAIYQHGYRIRLRDALKKEFLGLQCMAGSQLDALLDDYIAEHPSAHYNIRWHGSELAAYLRETHRDKPQLADMAQLDWAISIAFDAADEPSLGTDELASVPPAAWANLRLDLQANLHLLTVTHNVDAFRRAADRATARPGVRRLAKPRRIAVWRHATTVHYRVLENDEWPVLSAARRGEPFAALCALSAEHHGDAQAAPRMVSLLRTWLAAGLIRGLTT
ncbi:DNA-binding domain-containing protein [Dyella sp. 2HG41-7]|uniref:HvfC/BufC N-terminal domain-containing protein n=1 Tax=Dyella sp. 2HG41-7 TaxID=2883239 RepID=UPI001F1E3655|nr:DNA-binding domain-containing protein [Dyella sp. 2HG41-7]